MGSMWYDTDKRKFQLPDVEGETDALPHESYADVLAEGNRDPYEDPDVFMKAFNKSQGMKRWASLYIDQAGRIHWILNHQHIPEAQRVMGRLHGKNPGYKPASIGVNHFTAASGILRVQLSHAGVAVQVDADRPPTPSQLNTLQVLLTSNGGDLTTEIWSGGQQVSTLKGLNLLSNLHPMNSSHGTLLEFLASVKPKMKK